MRERDSGDSTYVWIIMIFLNRGREEGGGRGELIVRCINGINE